MRFRYRAAHVLGVGHFSLKAVLGLLFDPFVLLGGEGVGLHPLGEEADVDEVELGVVLPGQSRGPLDGQARLA
jgi:hypothetical protein